MAAVRNGPDEREFVYGIHSVLGALRARRRPVRQLWIALERRSDPKLDELLNRAREQRIPVSRVSGVDLDRLAAGGRHQGVVAEASSVPEASLEALLGGGSELVVVLDQIEDPRNLGAIIRTAAAVGATAVVLPSRRTAPLGPTALKVAEGAAEYVPVVTVVNVARTLGELKQRGVWCVGLEPSAEKGIDEVDLTLPTALVLGSEGHGLRRLVRENCDFLASLPVRREVGSVNVSVAAGVALFEVLRQRRVARP